jgi:nucleoside 2-deoxyribosyltransferase
VTCAVCGTYGIEYVVIRADILAPDVKPILSAIVRRHFVFTERPETITIDNWEALISQAPAKNDVPSRVRCLLRYIDHKSRFPGDTIAVDGNFDYPICFAGNSEEFYFYLRYAEELCFLKTKQTPSGVQYVLSAKGWEETRRIVTLDSPYAFVAMSFSKEGERGELLTKAFAEAIQPAIEMDAGYQKAIRIDKEEFLNDIVFEIIARIKECRFVVADVTDHRNGVYFEAGYAMGMGLPVIWTCHEDDMKTAHFDTNHLPHIVWKDIDGLRKSLANRILATIGRGPVRKSDD